MVFVLAVKVKYFYPIIESITIDHIAFFFGCVAVCCWISLAGNLDWFLSNCLLVEHFLYLLSHLFIFFFILVCFNDQSMDRSNLCSIVSIIINVYCGPMFSSSLFHVFFSFRTQLHFSSLNRHLFISHDTDTILLLFFLSNSNFENTF